MLAGQQLPVLKSAAEKRGEKKKEIRTRESIGVS